MHATVRQHRGTLLFALMCAAWLPPQAIAGDSERPGSPRYSFPAADVQTPTELDPIIVTPTYIPVPHVRINPPYPVGARSRWEEGCVLLEYVVRTDGKTDAFKVLDANPPGVFEAGVIMAVARWQYEPSPQELTLTEYFEFKHPIRRTSSTWSMSRRPTRGSASKHGVGVRGYQPPTCRR